MDIPSMMKINELSKELVKKGFAPNSEEASKMAEQFIQKGELPETSKKTDDYDKFDVLLERLQRKFNNDIGSLKEQLSSMINELNFIKEDIKKIKLNREVRPSFDEIKKPKLPDEKQETLEPEKKQFNQRTGGLKPGDVNIEDYFYYGDKKKQ